MKLIALLHSAWAAALLCATPLTTAAALIVGQIAAVTAPLALTGTPNRASKWK